MIDDDESGYLCAPADAAEFAARIRGLAADRPLVERLKAGARASAEDRLSAEDAFARFESALHEAIEYRRRHTVTAGSDVDIDSERRSRTQHASPSSAGDQVGSVPE
jgi:hypothetical protein